MSRKKFNSRALRKLAKELVRTITEEEEIPEDERADFVTSLVRQWITYDGNATLFLGDEQIYFNFRKTPLGQPCIVQEPGLLGWIEHLSEAWKIRREDFTDVIRQLNLGQSAEVTNADGEMLRLWVNPETRSRGVESLVRPPARKRAARRRDGRKIAAHLLEQHFGTTLPASEMEALACSMAKQWLRFEGHACVFLDADEQILFTLTERDDGGCGVVVKNLKINLEPLLDSLGFAQEAVSDVIARINLGQEVEFRDKKGILSVLWHDPKSRRIRVRPLAPAPPTPQSNAPLAPQSNAPPIFCPNCRAVMRPWNGIERQQTCPVCGHAVSS